MNIPNLHRRDFLYGLGSSLGALAMTDLLAKETARSIDAQKADARAQGEKRDHALHGRRAESDGYV